MHNTIATHRPAWGRCLTCGTASPCDPLLVAQAERAQLEGVYIGPWYAGHAATARLLDRLGEKVFAARAAGEAERKVCIDGGGDMAAALRRWRIDRDAHGPDRDGCCAWHALQGQRVQHPCASRVYYAAGAARLAELLAQRGGPVGSRLSDGVPAQPRPGLLSRWLDRL